jgi:hypothetical protein
MKSDDFFRDESDGDEATTPLNFTEDPELSALLARHLETHDPLPVPLDFRRRVHQRVRSLRRWRDCKLVLAVALSTASVLTVVITCALGLNWWKRLVPAIQPRDALAALRSLPAHLPAYIRIAETAEGSLRGIFSFLPVALLLFAIGALTLELAIFRYLHLGPFAHPRRNLP